VGLFEELFLKEKSEATPFWHAKAWVLKGRLNDALKKNKRRYNGKEGEGEQAEKIKGFVERYCKEYEDGYTPFVMISY
jgi:hypothetical protein